MSSSVVVSIRLSYENHQKYLASATAEGRSLGNWLRLQVERGVRLSEPEANAPAKSENGITKAVAELFPGYTKPKPYELVDLIGFLRARGVEPDLIRSEHDFLEACAREGKPMERVFLEMDGRG